MLCHHDMGVIYDDDDDVKKSMTDGIHLCIKMADMISQVSKVVPKLVV